MNDEMTRKDDLQGAESEYEPEIEAEAADIADTEPIAENKKTEFSSLSAAAGRIMEAVDNAGTEAASAAQDVEVSAAKRAADNQAEIDAAQEETSKASAGSGSDRTGAYSGYFRDGVMAGAQEAAVDYSVAKGSSIDVFSDSRSGKEKWKAQDDAWKAQEEEIFGTRPSDGASGEYAQPNDRISGSYSSIYSDTEGGGTYSPIPEEPTAKKSGGLLKKILAGVLAVCMCFLGGYGGSVLGNRVSSTAGDSGSDGSGVNAGAVSISGDVDTLDAASVIAEKMMPSVVGISTVSQTLTETIFGLQSGESMGIGTGLIVSEDGYILTNSHVVNDGDAETITVDLYDGTEYSGTILWNDASLDLAIVKIDASGLTAAELGDSDTVAIGDYALAIGNPLGLDFERSVTSGIISGLNRSITVASSTDSTSGNTMDGLIQTDASINSGNSGGPLINSSGQVIGINSAKASSAEGLGFAIPINVAIPIIEEIMETGTFESAYIGISGYDLAAVAASLETEYNTSTGVYVNEIYVGSGAADAGLQSGDVIVALNGNEVDSMSSLKKQLINYRPGDTVSITVERSGEEITVDVVLGSASDMTETVQNGEGPENGDNPDNGDSNGDDGQMPDQPDDNGYGYNPGGLGDLFNDFFGN